jgi:hypothetical protein
MTVILVSVEIVTKEYSKICGQSPSQRNKQRWLGKLGALQAPVLERGLQNLHSEPAQRKLDVTLLDIALAQLFDIVI